MRYLILLAFVFKSHAQISDFDGVDFTKADRIALEHHNEKLDNLPELSRKLTSKLSTDVERFRAIFTWVCTNIANDYGFYHKNMSRRRRYKTDSVKLKNWNSKFRKATLKKLLRYNKTICTGYAYLLKELSDLANIECEIVHGFAKTSTINVENLDVPNHSWNAVKLNEKWYLCDPTWASGVPNPETNLFEFDYNDGFFLANPKLFVINHFPLDERWLLLKEDAEFKTFIEAPILYGEAYSNLNNHFAPVKMHNEIKKNEIITLKLQLKKPVDTKSIKLLIDNGYDSKKITPKVISSKGLLMTIEHTFKSTGFYDVHLYIGDDLISTYTVKVKS